MVRGLTRLGAPLALATAVVMSGCAPVGPNYARPPVLTPPEYRFVDTPQQAASLADLPWWQVFSDPTQLDAILQRLEATRKRIYKK